MSVSSTVEEDNHRIEISSHMRNMRNTRKGDLLVQSPIDRKQRYGNPSLRFMQWLVQRTCLVL